MATPGFITVTPLCGEELHFRSMTGGEEIGQPFEYAVDVLSKNPDIKLFEALGQKMTVTVQYTESGARHFNGLVTRLSQTGMFGNYYAYRAVLHPWLWFLGRASDCRIFQNKSVPEIVGKIFRKYPMGSFRVALEKPGQDYLPREYTVQYRETDLSFVSRLLEEVGISYHFVHGPESHTLVLTDSISGREHEDGYAKVPLRAAVGSGQIECLTTWHVSQDVKTAAYVLKDFDYLNSGASLLSQLVPGEAKDRRLLGEYYDYPGRYLKQAAGDRAVQVRLNEAQAYYETIHAAGTTRGLGVGNIFMLTEAPWSDGKTEHLVVRADYQMHGHDPESGGGGGGEENDFFECSLTLVSSQLPFRPPCRTPRPFVQGPQTAIVVGPHKDDDNPEEIWTDDLGRVLVRFHWERLGPEKPNDPERADDDKDNESTPCFVRVASLWAGKQWGIQFTPRIGEEVMVEFLEGDPDRPIVTGRVYNNLHKPPYANAKKTQSGIKTRSSKGGGPDNFNEIRFEDKKGQEELYVQAEKDHNIKVKANRSLSVGANDAITVGGTRSTTVTKKDTVTLKDEHEMTVTNLVTETFNKGHTLNVHGADQTITITEGKTETITKTYGVKADGIITIESKAQITLKVGESSITIAPDRVEITAKQVAVTGTIEALFQGAAASITAHAPGVEITGTAIKLNG